MPAQRHLDALEIDGVSAFFVDDVPARQALAQRVLQGLRHALHPFARAQHQDAPQAVEVIDLRAGDGGAERLELGLSHQQPVPFHPHQLTHIVIGVRRLQASLDDRRDQPPTFRIAMRGQLLPVADGHPMRAPFVRSATARRTGLLSPPS